MFFRSTKALLALHRLGGGPETITSVAGAMTAEFPPRLRRDYGDFDALTALRGLAQKEFVTTPEDSSIIFTLTEKDQMEVARRLGAIGIQP